MKKFVWEVRYASPPAVLKHCRKCGNPTEYVSSECFRVNAQRKSLDIWLIYNCKKCKTSWNLTIFSRINPQSLDLDLLEKFHSNDKELASEYAANIELIKHNGGRLSTPDYEICGEDFSFDDFAQLQINSPYSMPVKVSSVIREKLNLSKKQYEEMLADGRIKSVPERDLQKCKLNGNITVLFNSEITDTVQKTQ